MQQTMAGPPDRTSGKDAALGESAENPAYRMLLDAIDRALRDIRGKALDERVHSARKSVKQARAALRLLRGGLGERRYRQENAALRNAGRILSPLRDAKVLAGTLDKLQERHPDELPDFVLSQLRDDLRANLDRTRSRLRHSSATNGLKRCAAVIKACRDRLTQWGDATDDRILWDGLRELYRKARKAGTAARARGDSATLHEWAQAGEVLSQRDRSAAILQQKPSAQGAQAGR